MAKILVIHGPNLNLLGKRQPEHYGTVNLETINARLVHVAKQLNHTLQVIQSNAEHVLLERIQATMNDKTQFIIINPAAYAHTSIALRDALLAVAIPFIEVHLSNLYSREPLRHCSYFSDIAVGTICGFGALGYELALQAAASQLSEKEPH